jgi:hypothetical protein
VNTGDTALSSFTMHMERLSVKALLFTLSATLCLACGGGGGSSSPSPNYPGTIYLSVERTTMDTGDMIRVRVALEDLNRDGVILKVRYARSLKYQRNSAFINTDPNNGDYSQTQRFSSAEEQTGTADRYLVFFFDRNLYRRQKELVAEFDLKALTPDEKAFIEVDLDKNDPNVPDKDEFSLERPLFSAIDTIPIVISGTAKPTPASGTPAATGTAAATTTPKT